MCGNDPAILLGAAHELAKLPGIVAVDLNLGCPQGIARRGHYGAFLLEETERLVRIVWTLARGPDAVPCPVTCKVRILPTMEATMKLCHALVGAGCSVLTGGWVGGWVLGRIGLSFVFCCGGADDGWMFHTYTNSARADAGAEQADGRDVRLGGYQGDPRGEKERAS